MTASIVLITGGSSGIGKAMVYHFAQKGYEVHFTFNKGKDSANQIIKDLSKYKVFAHPFDQGNNLSQQNLISLLPKKIDILINNAGLGSATVKIISEDEFLQDQALIQVNATGALWLTKSILEKMKIQNFGKIIFISSVGGGITQFPQFKAADGMSKAAIAFYAKQLAAENTHTGIDVFTICPGATETAMFEASTLKDMSSAERVAFENKLPKKRLIQPEEIAKLAFYLAQPEAQIMHGAVIDASMGLGVHPGLLTGKP